MQNSQQYSSGKNYETPELFLSHVDADGEACMVDVSAKDATVREAIAIGRVHAWVHVSHVSHAAIIHIFSLHKSLVVLGS